MNLPQPVAVSWLSDVVDMAIVGHNDPFKVRRIERDAQLLLEKGAERAEICWLVLAFTAFLQGKPDECVRKIDAAFALAKYDELILGNAASLMINAGEPRRGLLYTRHLAALADLDARQISNVAFNLFSTLYFEEAADMIRARLPHEEQQKSASFLQDADAMGNASKESGVVPELRLALLEAAVSAVRAEGFAIRQTTLLRYPDDSMRYELYVDASASQCGNVNFAIAETLTESFDNAHPELITFACRPLVSYTARGSYIEVMR